MPSSFSRSAAAVCVSADVLLGPWDATVSFHDFLRVLSRHLFYLPVPSDISYLTADRIVWQIRLPRALEAALIGALLAYAGVALAAVGRSRRACGCCTQNASDPVNNRTFGEP